MEAKTIGCDYCGTQVAPNALVCPCCGGRDPAYDNWQRMVFTTSRFMFWSIILYAAFKISWAANILWPNF